MYEYMIRPYEILNFYELMNYQRVRFEDFVKTLRPRPEQQAGTHDAKHQGALARRDSAAFPEIPGIPRHPRWLMVWGSLMMITYIMMDDIMITYIYIYIYIYIYTYINIHSSIDD